MATSSKDPLSRAIAGDKEALTQLLQQYGPALRRRFQDEISARWQSVFSLDDLIQETYVDAFIHIGDFVPRGEGSFEGWLTTIAKNNLRSAAEMLTAAKRGGKRRRIELGRTDDSYMELYDLLGGTTSTPSRHAARAEARGALEKVLQQLPKDHRSVVQMYDLEGKDVEEVAKALQRSPGAIFMLRARAHRALQRLLGAASKYFTDPG